jgi:hypothetical protein
MASSVVAGYVDLRSPAPQLKTIGDNSDGAFIPASAYPYERYRQRCQFLWRVTPGTFEKYERFLGKIEERFGLAAAEEKLGNTATELIKGTCIDIDYVGLEELEQ